MDKKKLFALFLHDLFCAQNHTDQCSWYYELKDVRKNDLNADWERSEHKHWLKKADEVTNFLNS